MKTLNKWLLPLAIAGSAVAGWAFFGPPPPPPFYTPTLTATPTTSGGNEFSFSVASLPPYNNASDIRLLLYHGDGTFFMGNLAEFAVHRHTYSPGATYQAFVEVVKLYDDTVDPKRSAVHSVQPGSGSFTLTKVVMGNKKVLLQRDADAVPGDSVTYIITFENSGRCKEQTVGGEIRFKFDSNIFSYHHPDDFHNQSNAGVTYADASGVGTVKIPFSSLAPGEQRSVLVLLETRLTAPLNTVMNTQKPTAEFVITDSPDGCTETLTDEIVGQMVLASHDPNYKVVMGENNMCGEYITWRVYFQNLGNAPEDSVVIYDWIDPLLDFATVDLLGSNFPMQNITEQSFPTERIWKYTLNPIDLKGLKESPAPREDLTRGYIELKAKKDAIHPCNAVVNRARIHFSCNPPIETREFVTPFLCRTNPVCDTACIEVNNRTLNAQVLSAGDSLFSPSVVNQTWYNDLKQQASYWKWYPTDGLLDPLALNPKLTTGMRREYILVASFPDSCRRTIVKVPVEPACQLQLNVLQRPNRPCSGNNPTWDVEVTASGADPANLLWNKDCATNTNKIIFNGGGMGLIPQILYVSAWDVTTGCAVEKWIKVGGPCDPPIDWWHYLLYLALGAIAVFLVLKFLKKI